MRINSNLIPYPYFPVGYIYLSVNDTNPKDIFGYGTWERIAKGRTLVGVDEDDTDFNESKLELGEKEHTLTVDEMPSHSHNSFYSTSVAGGGSWWSQANSGKTVPTTKTGGNKPHNNIQPSFTCYIWCRTA